VSESSKRTVQAAALQHRQLVPQGQDFEVERGALMCQHSQGQKEQVQYRDRGREAYPSSAVTSTAAGRNGLFSRDRFAPVLDALASGLGSARGDGARRSQGVLIVRTPASTLTAPAAHHD
jgi:hypothetical protein